MQDLLYQYLGKDEIEILDEIYEMDEFELLRMDKEFEDLDNDELYVKDLKAYMRRLHRQSISPGGFIYKGRILERINSNLYEDYDPESPADIERMAKVLGIEPEELLIIKHEDIYAIKNERLEEIERKVTEYVIQRNIKRDRENQGTIEYCECHGIPLIPF